ncbi:MAG: hypothetical protein P8K27_04415 [Gammaproteobacteria bacterium]|nr:hypothetical protein [Gammaproteobacteria bacterium]
MIERLQRIASFLAKIRFVIIILGTFSFLVLVISFIDNPWFDSELWSIPSLLLFCWSLALFSLEELFVGVPKKLDKGASWHSRIWNTMRRFGLRVLGLAFIILSTALLVLSYQLLRTWFMD